MLLTESVYRVVSYALFARHKLTFSFMLCAGIMRHSVAKSFEATINEEEWNWFVRGSAVAAISDRLENEEDLDSGVQPSSIAGANQCYQEHTVSIVLCALVKRCFNYCVARTFFWNFFVADWQFFVVCLCLLMLMHRAPVAQLVEHRAVTREVVSSTPVGPTLRVFR